MVQADSRTKICNRKISAGNSGKDQLLTADRLLIDRYKNRSFIDRLLNRQPDDSDLKIDAPKETYVLEAEKEE